jgi:hypothetical protein
MLNSERGARDEAVRRGMEFMYRTACDARHFGVYGHDFLFCFYCIASTSRDTRLRRTAREMGAERGRLWRAEHAEVPAEPGADDIVHLVFGGDAAERFGLKGAALKEQIREAAARFGARDYFWFDPLTEGPPGDVPETSGCGGDNPRGRERCREGRRRLASLGRYGVMNDALIRTYIGERYGVTLGAPYAEVFKWLPTLRPYRGREGGRNEEFYWTVYAVTHVVYTLNDYGARRLSPHWLPDEYDFLTENLEEAAALKDAEMMGEFLDTLKAFGLADDHPLIRRGTEFVLAEQHPDGSWGNPEAEDIYLRYHPTFTAVNGLRDYAWRGGELSPARRRLLEETRGRAANNF